MVYRIFLRSSIKYPGIENETGHSIGLKNSTSVKEKKNVWKRKYQVGILKKKTKNSRYFWFIKGILEESKIITFTDDITLHIQFQYS